MSNPHQPDPGPRVMVAQALRCGNGVGVEGVVPTVNVNGDDVANMAGLQLPLDVSPVDFIAQGDDCVTRAVWCGGT